VNSISHRYKLCKEEGMWEKYLSGQYMYNLSLELNKDLQKIWK